jgi:class 3 adenylate cyclase
MDTSTAKRRLTAILNADVKGYSHLMTDDEEATVQTLTAYREIMATLIGLHRGRLVDSPGDNLLAEFASVVDAVQCAVEIQRELQARNQELPEHRRMEFRIGVNLGDVIEEGDRIYGEGVNVAARLESLAQPGGVSISRTVYDQVKNKLSLGFEYLGEHAVKNVKDPVRLYRVHMHPEVPDAMAGHKTARQRRRSRAPLVLGVLLLVVAGGMVALLKSFLLPESSPPLELKLSSEGKIIAVLPKESAKASQSLDSLVSHPGRESASDAGVGVFRGHPDGDGLKGHAIAYRQTTLEESSSPYERKVEQKGVAIPDLEMYGREVQDGSYGVSPKILKLQSLKKVEPPSLDQVVAIALKAAQEAAQEVIDMGFHKGETHTVPGDFETIQSAIDSARRGDVVVVKPGTYFELIVMKDGVKLVSDSAEGGDEVTTVEGAQLRLPRRTLRTIIDGSMAETSRSGIIDFNPGVGRHTIVDGFTIQNLPKQNHHIHGHPHGLNLGGASPIITNCYLRNNGSTAIGNHVVYADQDSPMPKRDFRWANVKHRAEAVIYRNIIRDSLGLGIGCDHFSAPLILGNEVLFNNDAAFHQDPSPGIGVKHGAAPRIIGNIVHDNPGGGILSNAGALQGTYGIDRPTCPTVMKNVVYRNGNLQPGIGCGGTGSSKAPARFIGNFVYECGFVGIGFMDGAVAVVEDNTVSGSGAPGIMVSGATVVKLNRNQVTGAKAPGIAIVSGSKVLEMVGNAADSNHGPRFVLRGGSIAGPDV